MKRQRTTLLLILLFLPLILFAEKSIYVPVFSSTLRARYEFLPREEKGAFKVRDFRLGIDGYVAPILSYCGEINISDWGRIALVNAFLRCTPVNGLSLSMGQQRIPFTIAAHRAPFQQFFSNRPFLAKHAGIRDIGFVAGYTIPKVPLTVQGSIFNCSGLGEHKIYWTNTYGYSFKIISPFLPHWYASASTARMKRGSVFTQNWDIGAFFDNGLWHVEGEYLRKNYDHDAFKPVNAYDFFVYRKFPIEKKMIGNVSGALRYDYMSDHSTGVADDEGKLIVDNPACHRITLGATLSLQSKFQADFRLNYEKCFFKKGVVTTTSNDDRIVFEIIGHF